MHKRDGNMGMAPGWMRPPVPSGGGGRCGDGAGKSCGHGYCGHGNSVARASGFGRGRWGDGTESGGAGQSSGHGDSGSCGTGIGGERGLP